MFPTPQRRLCSESTIVSEGFKGGTRGTPIMPRDVSLSDSKCWNGGHEWVNTKDFGFILHARRETLHSRREKEKNSSLFTYLTDEKNKPWPETPAIHRV